MRLVKITAWSPNNNLGCSHTGTPLDHRSYLTEVCSNQKDH